jgi:acyl carrier protein
MKPASEEKLREIFAIVLELGNGEDVASLRKVAHPRWDSLAHTSIVAAIESEFAIELDTADMERLTSYAATRLLLEEKGL